MAWLLAWDPATVPVGGSDFHSLDNNPGPGHPTTWVLAASLSASDILDGLSAGRTSISEWPSGPLLLRCGDTLTALGADGLLLTDLTGRRLLVHGDRWSTPAAAGVCWLEDHRTKLMALAA